MIDENLMIRYFSGTSSVEDRRQLLAWIAENPENENHLFVLKDLYDANHLHHLYKEAETKKGWEKIYRHITSSTRPEPKNRRWIRTFTRYAAVFMLGTLITSLFTYYLVRSGEKPPAAIAGLCEVQTAKGERAMVTLPDGSVVKLNACSRLSYSSDFGKKDRNLRFTGEGYFDVHTNPQMPFTVKTAGLNIKAFGTTFNVKAYEDENDVETTLIEGSVFIESQTNQPIATLKPNQTITIPKSHVKKEQPADPSENLQPARPAKKPTTDQPVLTENIRQEIYTSWKDDKWVIKAENMESLMRKIERKYDVTVSIKDESVKKYVFSGTLKSYPLEQVLEVLSLNAPIRFAIKENHVEITEDKQLKIKYEKLIHSPQ
ncbi:MAG: FecR family protein [Bacteroidales bacterium]|jgi:ferric-dicitrate binding protein FerR (iron transport regulator)|nr:FecR family protein [Bacteroidales bacterium]